MSEVWDHTVQVLAVDDVEFLERHDATLCFGVGRKVGVEWRRPDGLLLQHSGWGAGHAIAEARKALRRWETPCASQTEGEK